MVVFNVVKELATFQRWYSCSLLQLHRSKSWSCSQWLRRCAPPPAGWSTPTTPCCIPQSELSGVSWCSHLSRPFPPQAWRDRHWFLLHLLAWDQGFITLKYKKCTTTKPGGKVTVTWANVRLQLCLKVVQLLFDFDNLLRKILLVPQCASGGEHLPDEGRHGEEGGGGLVSKQIGSGQQLSRAECTSGPPAPAPAASQLNFPATYFPLQGTCTDLDLPFPKLISLGLPLKYMEHLTALQVKIHEWQKFTWLWTTNVCPTSECNDLCHVFLVT